MSVSLATEEPAQDPGTEPEAQTQTEPVQLTEEQVVVQPVLPDWATRRVADVTRNLRDAERERDLLKAQLEGLKKTPEAGAGGAAPTPAPTPGPLSEAEFNARVAAAAEQRVFDEASNGIAVKGKAQFKDFAEQVGNFGTYLGGISRPIVEGALETDDPARTIYELGKNMEEASRISNLSPARQAAAVVKFASKLPAAKVPPVGEGESTSGTTSGSSPTPPPPPIRPKVGTAGGDRRTSEIRLDDENVSMADWMKKRNETLKKK